MGMNQTYIAQKLEEYKSKMYALEKIAKYIETLRNEENDLAQKASSPNDKITHLQRTVTFAEYESETLNEMGKLGKEIRHFLNKIEATNRK